MKTTLDRLTTIPLLLVLAWPFAACGSTRSSRIEAGPEKGSDTSIESRLEILDPRTIQAGAEKRVELVLHNKSSKPIEFLFTVDWFDRAGKPVPLASRRWSRVALDGDERQPVRIEPMPPEAAAWQPRFWPTEHR